MSLKVIMLHSHLDYFPDNQGMLDEEQEAFQASTGVEFLLNDL